jgi:hypothetical protein
MMTPLEMMRRARARRSGRPVDAVAAALPPLPTPRPAERPLAGPVMPAARLMQTPPTPQPEPAHGPRRAPDECAQCGGPHPGAVARRWNPVTGWHTWTAP